MSAPPAKRAPDDFVRWFRQAAPYIHAFRGKTFVIAFGGELFQDAGFVGLVHDFNLLMSLGVRLVLVHGVRPQVEARLKAKGVATRFVAGRRVTDALALECVKEAVGAARVDVEAQLSMGLPNSPMAGADIRVASGNFVIAKPMGVLEGVDLQHTGEVRRVDTTGIARRLDQGEIVLLSPLGYSPTGEVFNLTVEDVATAAASGLKAHKLIFLMETMGVADEEGALLKELTAASAQQVLVSARALPEDVALYLPCAIRAARAGVARAHLLSRHVDGALLSELFTHGGVGTMVTREPVESLRQAAIDDVGGILALIEPLESEGILVRRSRELLEMEIGRFRVLEHDNLTIGCAALYPFEQDGAAELACLAVHPDYRSGGRGERLLAAMEAHARAQGIHRLFVLTTRAAHWFVERGFEEADVGALPQAKQSLYNWQRRSKVFVKGL
ncbi:MAG: amino-acid N-acetyltransferase [Betaproteobacteria bacterium]|nr:amino-acid N-acetyltransferase [Betaproteobacteria bacterium]